MNADTYIVNDFNNHFAFLKNQNVVLYGTGQFTRLIVEGETCLNIVGLMDANKTGEIVYGYRVLSEEEVLESGCGNIIIISNLSVAPQIYGRIKHFAKEHGIQVWYMNGAAPKGAEGIAHRVPIRTGQEAGYLFFGPLTLGYMTWLLDAVRRDGIEHLLFVSRDGYLFYNIYQKFFGEEDFPRASYFLTSRRAASIASVRSEEDVRFILKCVVNRADRTTGEILEYAYGIEADESDELREVTLAQVGKEEMFLHIKERYLSRIIARAALERARYMEYVQTLGLEKDAKIGIMNFVGRGVTQMCLQKMLDREMTGYYAAAEYEVDDILTYGAYKAYYPQKMSTHTASQNIYIQYLQGEAVFSAPQGQLREFADGGEPVYEPTDADRVAVMNECHEGIMKYIEDYCEYVGAEHLKDVRMEPSVVDAVFGLLSDKRFALDERLQRGLVFEDGY